MSSQRPRIPILRNLARTGGTLITKCLGSMDGLVVLSEVHPANLKQTNPMAQASEWFGLVGPGQLKAWRRAGGPTLPQFVWVCDQAARARGETLVIREWSHLDYHGAPFTEPTMTPALPAALDPVFECVETCTVRHPIDQYLSIRGTAIGAALGFDAFLEGCLAFARRARETGFVRYEDFTRDPDPALRTICERLGVPFDPGYRDRWWSYTTVTGDTARGVGRGVERREIAPMPRGEIDEDLLARFRSSRAHAETCEILGYDPERAP